MAERTFGSEIRALRNKAGKRLRGFAAELEISAAHLSDIEHNRRRPSAELLAKIAKRLGHVGAVLADLRALNTAIDPATREWASTTPYVGEMLRQLRDSGMPPQKIIEHIEQQKRKGESDQP